MGYSMNNLNNAVNHIQNRLDERSQQRGQELADKIIHGNLIGYIFARWFNFISLYVTFGLILNMAFGMREGMTYLIAFVPAILVLRTDRFWYMGFWKAVGLFAGLILLASLWDSL